MKGILFIFLQLSSLAAFGQATPAVRQPQPPETNALSLAATSSTNAHIYRVKSGDTDLTIARKFGMTRKALLAANPDVPMARLKVGQGLVIPVANWVETNAAPKSVSKMSDPPRPAPATTAYVVGRRDTAKKIAKKHGICLSALLAANPGLDPARMKTGQAIVIPQKPVRSSGPVK